MTVDEYGLTSIASLCYDTPDHRLIRASMEHTPYKEKIRLRYCTRAESVGVKTTAMGSMFRLSYRILCRKRH